MKSIFSVAKILIITIFTFILLDFVFGKYLYKKFIRKNFKDVDTSFAIKDKVYDHKFASNFKGLAGWGNIRFEFCTDSNGFRSSCEDQFRNTKNFDIGFIGDSFTEAVGVDYKDSFVGVIESNLKNQKIANLAVASYGTAIYFSKINYLLDQGYNFKEIFVFIDLSDIVDDTLCYKLDNGSVKRRSTFKKCFEGDLEFQDSLNEFLKKRLRLTYETTNLLKNKLVEKKIISLKPSLLQGEHERSKWTYKYESAKYNNYSLEEATNIQFENMNKLSSLLKSKNIDLTIAVYPWPGTLKNDVENNKQTILWREFCKNNCKNFYNFMKPFFEISKNKEFYEVYKMFYIENDYHFNELGNKIIADNFLKLYNQK